MSKSNRIAAYFTDGVRRLALVDNFGLIDMTSYVSAGEYDPVRANAHAVVEALVGNSWATTPMYFDHPNGVSNLSPGHIDIIKQAGCVAYKFCIDPKDGTAHLWFENGKLVTFKSNVAFSLTPINIAHFLKDDNAQFTGIVSSIVKVRVVGEFEKEISDYFGWIRKEDVGYNESLRSNQEIITYRPKTKQCEIPVRVLNLPQRNPHPLDPLMSYNPAQVLSQDEMVKIILAGESPLAFIDFPDNIKCELPGITMRNTQRIPAKENSEAVWDGKSLVETFWEVWGDVLKDDKDNISAATEKPTAEDLELTQAAIEGYLKENWSGSYKNDNLLTLLVAKNSQPKFLNDVWRMSYHMQIPLLKAFKELYGSDDPSSVVKKKSPKKFKLTTISPNISVITDTTTGGKLTLHFAFESKGLTEAIKELSKLKKLTLAGENTIGVASNLSITKGGTLVMSNTSFLGTPNGTLKLTGYNVFSNVSINSGTFENTSMAGAL